MKSIITIVVICQLMAYDSYSQRINNNDNIPKISYSKVVEVVASKNELYMRALLFISTNFNNANEAIQLKDLETGKIIVRGSFMPSDKYNLVVNGSNRFTMVIEVKDNKYRYSFSDIINSKFGNLEDATKNAVYESQADDRIGKDVLNELRKGQEDAMTTLYLFGLNFEDYMKKSSESDF